jgi:N-methylhydantoinase A
MVSPFDPEMINDRFQALRNRVHQQLEEEGIPRADQEIQLSLDMRHKGQINEVEISVKSEYLEVDDLKRLQEQFFENYELIYGKGASLPWARLEAVTFRVRASAETLKPNVQRSPDLDSEIGDDALGSERSVYWSEPSELINTPTYVGEKLKPGNQIIGPAIIDTSNTTVVVHPGRTANVDAFGNFELTLTDELS